MPEGGTGPEEESNNITSSFLTTQQTTNDAIVDRDHHLTWRTWQRAFDYYPEGALIWLDADTLIRERSQGKRSLDDFARAFFGIDDASMTPVTYTFEDVVKALNAVEPNDWSAFLRERLDAVDKPAPLGGITRGGYKLVFNDTQNDYSKAADGARKRTSLLYSVGLVINEKNATIMDVLWETDTSLTVREVSARLTERNLAHTTVMTVLDRLAKKGFARRERDGRAWRYCPAATRETYVTELMLTALEQTGDRTAALTRFARSVSGVSDNCFSAWSMASSAAKLRKPRRA